MRNLVRACVVCLILLCSASATQDQSAIDNIRNDKEMIDEFNATVSTSILCIKNIEMVAKTEIVDEYVLRKMVEVIDVRCSNVLVGTYNLSKDGKLETFVGDEPKRKEGYAIIQIALKIFAGLLEQMGTASFPEFQRVWYQIHYPPKYTPVKKESEFI